MERISLIFSLFLALSAVFWSPVFSQKKSDKHAGKLKLVQAQIEAKKKELEKYISRQEELNVQMKSLKRSEAQTSSKKGTLENNIRSTQSEISGVRARYEALKNVYNSILKDLKNKTASLYLSGFNSSDYYGKNDLINGIVTRNLIINKSIFAKTVDSRTEKTGRDIKKLSARKEEIIREKKLVEGRLRKNKLAYNSAKKEMALTRKKYRKLEEELAGLKASAQDLTKLVKKLEKQAPYKSAAPKNDIGIRRKSLPWPVEGTVIGRFGKEYIGELKTWIVRDGIRIKAAEGAAVYPVLGGKVIYSGAFRNYGNVVILSHKEGFFTTYGLLSRIDVGNGDNVGADTPLGVVGEDLQALKSSEGGKSVLYFEIRDGSEAVDPSAWLK